MVTATHTPITAIAGLLDEGLNTAQHGLDITDDKLNSELKSGVDGDQVASLIVTAAIALNDGYFSKAKDHIAMVRGLIDPGIDRALGVDSCPYYTLLRLIAKLDNSSFDVESLSPHRYVSVGQQDGGTYCHVIFDNDSVDQRDYVALFEKYRQGAIVFATWDDLASLEDHLVDIGGCDDLSEDDEWC